MRGLGRSFFQEHRIGAAVSAVALALCAVGIVLVVTSSGDAAQPRGVSISSKVQSKAASVEPATIPLPPSTTPATEVAAGLPLTGPSAPRASNPAPNAAPSAPLPDVIIVCESTTIDTNGIETSSETVWRAPAGTPIPPGCHAG
jgi:hypothetical protein